jgi:hypothetical protein
MTRRFAARRFACTLAALLSLAHQAFAFSLIPASGAGPADLIAQPNNYYSFDEPVITWKMAGDFLNDYNDPRLQQQVRLAFSEWQTAGNSAERSSSPRWGWTRDNGLQDTIDLYSVVLHEIGHAMGLQHPDASYFNQTGPGNTAWLRNYRLDAGGDPFVAAPVGGEVMNEGNSPGFLPNQKAPKGISAGEYWRTLSRDEVAALDYAYPGGIVFQEVGPGEDAMITVETFAGQGGGNLGVSGPDTSSRRVPGDDTQGRRILTASIGISDNPNTPLGVLPRASAWSYTNNTGEALSGVSVRSEGTSTRAPLDTFSSGSHRFTDYDQANTFLLHAFENRGHRFTDPVGGSVPSGSTVEFGLELDVWDWTVERATAVTTEGEPIAIPVISLLGWNNGGFDSSPLPGVGSLDDHDGALHGLTTVAEAGVPSAQGFRIVAGDSPVVLTDLAFASVGGRGLGLDDLNPATLAQVETLGDLVRLPLGRRELAPHDDLVVVLQGTIDDLPPQLRQAQSFVLLNDPRWGDALAKGEVFLYGRAIGGAGEVGAFSLLNMAPIVGRPVPEPSAVLAAIAAIASTAGRRRRRTPR